MIRTPTDDFEDHYTNPYTKFFCITLYTFITLNTVFILNLKIYCTIYNITFT